MRIRRINRFLPAMAGVFLFTNCGLIPLGTRPIGEVRQSAPSLMVAGELHHAAVLGGTSLGIQIQERSRLKARI